MASVVVFAPPRLTARERVPFQPPPDWVWGNTQQTGDHLLMEFVKKGENIDAWTELLTLSAVPTDATIIAP
jgi:hypothetical protein